jgi:hypothetical protein
VLGTFLLLAGREQHLKTTKLLDAKQKLRQMLVLLAEIEEKSF